MFAVIKTGGKQYRVAAEDLITIEKLSAEAGETVTFEEVLLVGDGENATIGSPLVAGASVAGEVVEQTRGRKVLIFKKKRRKHYRRTQGHRQHLTLVRITDILTEGAKPTAKKRAAAKTQDETARAEPATSEAAAPEGEAKSAASSQKTAAKPKTESKAKQSKAKPGTKDSNAKSDNPAPRRSGGKTDTE